MGGLAIDPRQIAEWTWDQLAIVACDRKQLLHPGRKLAVVSAQEAYARGLVKLDPEGSVNQQIREGKIPAARNGQG